MVKQSEIVEGDIPETAHKTARERGVACLDLETSGLDWRRDRIATCQVFIPGGDCLLVRLGSAPADNLEGLLRDPEILKIFHYAMFDLRFMAAQWGVRARHVACTKVSSKILEPSEEKHSLKDLLSRHLGVRIDKGQRLSDWFAAELTQEQVEYALNDVRYLWDLFNVLRENLEGVNRFGLAESSFSYLPSRVELDLLGAPDVFQY